MRKLHRGFLGIGMLVVMAGCSGSVSINLMSRSPVLNPSPGSSSSPSPKPAPSTLPAPAAPIACAKGLPDIDTSGPRRVLRVGPGRSLKAPSAAAAIAQNNDIIEIEAAVYACDATKWNASNLTIRGICGRPHMAAKGCVIANGKGIWNPSASVVNFTVENIEFSGASVPDHNGAGIRYDGRGTVTIRNSVFHHNENGILFTPTDSGASSTTDLAISDSEFGYNGAGDGYTHNMYIGQARSFTLTGSYTHHSNIGHLVKSRANNNHILYNRIVDEKDGNSSYNIDLPQGGNAYIIGNIIQQGALSPNRGMVAFAAEATVNPQQNFYLAFNTFHNEIAGGGPAVRLYDKGLGDAIVASNLFTGFADQAAVMSYPTSGSTKQAQMRNNVLVVDAAQAGFQDVAQYNYYLTSGSPAIGAGWDPGPFQGIPLLPARQYLHPSSTEERPAGSVPAAGAIEFDGRVVSVPKIKLAASATTVEFEGSVTLSWSSLNALFCTGISGPQGELGLSGSWTSPPLNANKVFSLSCTGRGGTVSQSVAITVNDSAQAQALGTYTWQELPSSTINSVCAANLKDALGKRIYAVNDGTGPYCETKGINSTGVYVPEMGRWFLLGGGGTRSYYGNEVYAFNFLTQKPELATLPTLISETREYAPDDIYGSKIHLSSCDGILHPLSGGVAPAPRGIVRTAAYNPLSRKIIIGPSGYVRGIGDCTGSTEGQMATDMWSFDPFSGRWALLSGADDRFGSVTLATWFLDPLTGISFVAGNRNASTRGGYLVNSNVTPPPGVLVDNVWPFQPLRGPLAIDTQEKRAIQFGLGGVAPAIAVYDLNGLSMTAYGTNGSTGSTGTAGGSGPLYQPDLSWTFTGDTSLFSLSNFGLAYNPKLRKFVAWGGGETFYFMTPNYQTRTLDILSKRIPGYPTAVSGGPLDKFTYIPDRDLYLVFGGTDKNFYYLLPPR